MVENAKNVKSSDDPSANQFGVGYDGVGPDSQDSVEADNQFGTGHDGVDTVKNDKPANQFGTGHDGVASGSDEPANQFGLGHGGIEDFAIEAPYSDSEEEQNFDKLDIDIKR